MGRGPRDVEGERRGRLRRRRCSSICSGNTRGVFRTVNCGRFSVESRRGVRWRDRAKEVFFDQVHRPGELAQSDFTRMGGLGITLGGQPFEPPSLPFRADVLELGECDGLLRRELREPFAGGCRTRCGSWGGVPRAHQTDQLTAGGTPTPEGTKRRAKKSSRNGTGILMSHYGLEPRKIQVGQPNENGDVEQSHHRFKRGVEQALLLRGSCDFKDLEEYQDVFEGPGRAPQRESPGPFRRGARSLARPSFPAESRTRSRRT